MSIFYHGHNFGAPAFLGLLDHLPIVCVGNMELKRRQVRRYNLEGVLAVSGGIVLNLLLPIDRSKHVYSYCQA
jgi:hypothetical protein